MKSKSLFRTGLLSLSLVLMTGLQAWAGPDQDLVNAVKTNDVAGVRQALADGANVNYAQKGTFFSQSSNGMTPLLWAAVEGHANVAKILLDHGADPNKADDVGETPLLLAAGHSIDVVRALLNRGASINTTNVAGQTALMEAAAGGHADIVKLLIEHGADVTLATTGGDPHTAAWYAADDNHPEIVALIQNAAEIRAEYVTRKNEQAAQEKQQADQEKSEEIRSKLVSLAQDLQERFDSAPELQQPSSLPESYRKEMIVGLANIRDARTQDDYLRALGHFVAAAKIAPRVPAPYEALGNISETVGAYKAAADFLKLYLRAAPNAPNTRAIKDKLYELEDKANR